MRISTWVARAVATATAFGVLAVALPTAVSAGPAGGSGFEHPRKQTVELELSKKTAKKLRKAKVRIKGAGKDRTVVLGVRRGTVGTLAQLQFGGTLELRAKRGGKVRRAKVRKLGANLTTSGSQIFGRLAGKQLTFLQLAKVRDLRFDPVTGDVNAWAKRAKLDAQIRDQLQRRLRAKLPRALGEVRIRAQVDPVPIGSDQPPVLDVPLDAIDLIDAELTWRARESFVDYLHASGDQGGTAVKDGATNGPEEVIPPSADGRVYEFGFVFDRGWSMPGGTGDAAAYFTGTVNFFKLPDPFNIDLDAGNVEVELLDDGARLIALMNGREGNADQQNRRAVAVDLDLASVAPAVEATGGQTTRTWTDIPGFVPEGTDTWPIAGFYNAGDEWGTVTISITTEE